MQPRRDGDGSLAHVVETLLDKGLVLNADIMVSVAGWSCWASVCARRWPLRDGCPLRAGVPVRHGHGDRRVAPRTRGEGDLPGLRQARPGRATAGRAVPLVRVAQRAGPGAEPPRAHTPGGGVRTPGGAHHRRRR
ncbi:gas vesicle protein [Streptomyces sp. INA 01156]